MDLNVNYSDGLQKEFFFVKWLEMEEVYKTMTNVVDKRIYLKI